MKKIIFTLALVSFAMMSQAQIFVGGQVGFDSEKVKDDYKNSTLTIAPTIGYQFSEKFAAGVRINFSSYKEVDFKFQNDDDLITKTSAFGAELFAQYTFLSFGKFSVYADASVGFISGKQKGELGSQKEDMAKISGFGFDVIPVLAYNLTEKITLLANLNFLGLGFISSTVEDLQFDDKTVTNNFNVGVNSNNIITIGSDYNVNTGNLTTGGLISLGFICRF